MGFCLGLYPSSGPYAASTTSPPEMYGLLERWCSPFMWPHEVEPASLDVLVIEDFILHEGHKQNGSRLLTVRCIGALQYIAASRGIEVALQVRDIKKPTKARLQQAGIKPLAGDGHCKDAQLHWWCYVWRNV